MPARRWRWRPEKHRKQVWLRNVAEVLTITSFLKRCAFYKSSNETGSIPTFGAVRKATYVFLEEGQGKESVVFWQVVVRDSSSSYYKGQKKKKSLERPRKYATAQSAYSWQDSNTLTLNTIPLQ